MIQFNGLGQGNFRNVAGITIREDLIKANQSYSHEAIRVLFLGDSDKEKNTKETCS